MFGFTFSPRQPNEERDVVYVQPPSRGRVEDIAEPALYESLFRGLQGWPRWQARLSQAIHFQQRCRDTPLMAESLAAESGSGSLLARTVMAGLLDAHSGVIVKGSTAMDWAIRCPLPGQQLSLAVSYGRHLAALDPLYRIAFRRQFDSRRAAGLCADVAAVSAAKVSRQYFLQQTEAAMRLLVHLVQESRQQDRHDVVLSSPLVFEQLQLPAAESGSSLGELLRLLSALRFAELRFSGRDWRPELLNCSSAIEGVHWLSSDAAVVTVGPKLDEAIRAFSRTTRAGIDS